MTQSNSNRKPMLLICLMSAFAASSGCSAPYKTPGGAADFNVFADRDIKEVLDRKPASPIPAHLAVARVQAPEYRSYSNTGYGHGRFSVVTVRDVEQEEDFNRLAAMPEIEQVAPLNRLLLSDNLESDRQL